MVHSGFIPLINNAALLLALGLLYDMTGLKLHGKKNLAQQLLTGVVLGAIGIAIMLNPWVFGKGIVFDTRSVLLCISGFFFGLVPLVPAVIMTAAYRLMEGGAGAWTGVAVIVTSGGLGVAWGYRHRTFRKEPTLVELYLLGLVVHGAMLAWMLSLPWSVAMAVLPEISLPVMVIYPVVTVILGKLMVNRGNNRIAQDELRRREENFRNLFQNHSAVKLLVDPETRRIIQANKAAEKYYGWSAHDLSTMRIDDINTLPPERLREEIDKVRAQGQAYFEFRHRSAGGAIRDVEIYTSVIELNGKDTLHSIIHDVTERKRAQAALQESQRVLTATQHLAKIGGWEWTANSRAMSWTDEVYRIHDLDPAQFDPGSPEHIIRSLECYDPSDRIRIAEAFERCVKHGEPYDFEVPFTTVEGRRLWVRTTAQAVTIKGRIEQVVGNIMDITDRKLAEEQQAKSLGLLTNLARLVPGVIYQFRLYPDGRSAFPYASPGMVDIYEVLPDEVRDDATPVYGYLHPDDYDHVVATIRDSALSLKTFYCEYRVVLPRQGLRWRWSQAHPERMDDGGTLWHGIILDITDRKKTEEDLAHSHDLMRYIIEHNRSAIAVMDKNLRYIYVSQRFLDDHRVDEVTVVGKHHDEVFPNLPQKWRDVHQKALAGEVLSSDDDSVERQDGSVDWVRWMCRPWYEADGSIGGIVLYTEVVTERKVLEGQLAQALKMESVGRLAGGVAHDYNNMLGVILGYTELTLEKLKSDDALRPDLEQILLAARRSADITRQLLAFSRQQPIAPRRIDLNETVESMLTMLRRLIGEDLVLSWQPGAPVWPVFIDPSQLDQILVNLCVNARDAIGDVGSISIETSVKTFDDAYCADHLGFMPGDYVLLSVSDDGCGMDNTTMDKVFEPFYTTKEMGKGTGLGLATVYGVVKQNNGFINMYSEKGHGSTFRIYLPRYRGEPEDLNEEDQRIPAAQGNETILLVEDDPSILRMATIMLERLGYTVLTADNPDDASALARDNADQIQLLMTDVVMPEINGRELAALLQNICPSMKVLFMSGYTASVIADRGVLFDGVNFIQKPFSKQDLADKIRDVLDA